MKHKPTYIVIMAFITLLFCGFDTKTEVKSCNIGESTDEYTLNMNIPEISGLKNIEFQGVINANLKSDASGFAETLRNESKEYKLQAEKFNIPFRKFEGLQEFKVSYNGEKILSIPISRYHYAGGAHGNTILKSINIDKANGKELKLKDLFSEGYDYKSIIDRNIKSTIESHKDEYFPNAFKGINDNTEFFINDNGVVIYYQLYEIAPYVRGIPQFTIPYSSFEKGLLYKLP